MTHASPPSPPARTRAVREAHRFDEARLERYLAERLERFRGPLVVRQFEGGQSNPTFWLGTPERQYVLRKKPPGRLLPSAHAVEREHRVVAALHGAALHGAARHGAALHGAALHGAARHGAALHGAARHGAALHGHGPGSARPTPVPVPEPLLFTEDAGVVGTPFYVMAYVEGRIFRDPRLPDLAPPARAEVYDALVRVLAALHTVDVDAVGLGDFGRRGGYVARQVARWTGQYEASKTAEVAPMEALLAYLPAHVPASDETCLTHGDYRLDNVLFAEASTTPLAVLDWELSTLGHPLADLAYLGMAYDVVMPDGATLVGADLDALGIPTEDALLARYAALTGRDRVDDYAYFKAFSLFRLAAIAQGVYRRSLEGNASSTSASLFGAAVPVLAELACTKLGLAR